MFKDNLALTGALTIAINDKVVQKTENLVVTSGKAWVASLMGLASVAENAATHLGVDGIATMGVGTSGTTAADGNTTLTGSVSATLTSTTVGGTENRSVTYLATFAAGVAPATGIEEAGLFTTAGTMLARTDFDVVNKGAADTMTITWTITVS